MLNRLGVKQPARIGRRGLLIDIQKEIFVELVEEEERHDGKSVDDGWDDGVAECCERKRVNPSVCNELKTHWWRREVWYWGTMSPTQHSIDYTWFARPTSASTQVRTTWRNTQSKTQFARTQHLIRPNPEVGWSWGEKGEIRLKFEKRRKTTHVRKNVEALGRFWAKVVGTDVGLLVRSLSAANTPDEIVMIINEFYMAPLWFL